MKNLKFTLVLAVLMFFAKIGFSLTATVTVYWHGGWCTVCGTDYSCSQGAFMVTWNGGNNTFFDPMPAGATLTGVSVTTCEADCGSTSVGVSLNGGLVGTYFPSGNCSCYGSIFYTVSGGPTPYHYCGNNTLNLNPQPNTLNPLICICVSNSVITLTYTMNPPVITASGPLTFCQGSSVTLSVPAGNTYLWSNGVTTNTDVITTSGTYFVTITYPGGCGTAVAGPVTVVVNPDPVPTITANGPLSFCQGDSVTLTASAGNSYLWSTGAITQSITVTTAGNYTVTETNGNGCTGTSAPITVTILPAPTPTITASGPIIFCQGDSVILTASIGNSYLWNTGAITQSVIVYASGTYSVTETNANGCTGVSASTTVTVNPNPTPTITPGGPTTFCQGDSVVLTASGAQTYLWNTGANTLTITVTTSGNYQVTETSTVGCTGISAITVVTVNPLPTPTITAGGPVTFCAGGSVTLTSSPESSYSWSTGDITQSITVTSSGTYDVTVTDANGCQGVSNSITVTVNPLPNPTITASGPITFCQGGNVTLTCNPAGASYLWSNGAVTQSITVNTSGTYTVTLTDANGCVGTSQTPVVVTVNALPAPSITASGPTTFCAGDSVILTCNPAGASYLWSTNAVTQSITITTAGNYTVTLTDANGCVGTSSPITVVVNPLPTPTITASGPTAICAGSSVTLTCNPAGTSYLWSTGAVTQSITVTTAGNYTVTLTNANGCAATSAATVVTINPLPTPTISAGGPTSFCIGQNVVLTCNPAGASYLWSTGAVTQSITVTTAGNYTVTLTDANGCVGTSAQTTVSVNPLPVVNLGPDQNICIGTSTTLNAGAGTVYLWSTGATTPTITISNTGSYWVQVTNGMCTGSDTVNVTVTTPPIVTLGQDIKLCAGGTVTLDAGIPNNTYLWSTGDITQTTKVGTTGTYWVRVGSNGCYGYDTVTVGIAALMNFSLGSDTAMCPGDQLVVDAGKGYFGYFWTPGGESTHYIVVTQPGTYVCTVSDSFGCLASSTKFIQDYCPTDMYVPSAFSPDGGNNRNLTFMAYCTGAIEFHMYIFDRWGTLVYESADISQGWDGTINGLPASQGVYVYRIDYKTYDFLDLHKHTKTGSVTLIR
jgi:gliding motility-associated-like protein